MRMSKMNLKQSYIVEEHKVFHSDDYDAVVTMMIAMMTMVTRMMSIRTNPWSGLTHQYKRRRIVKVL